jgi:triphosphoribosyl-dephospho-CoA synthetase
MNSKNTALMELKSIAILMDKNSVWKRSRICIRIAKITKRRNKLEAEKIFRVMTTMTMKMRRKGSFSRFIGKNVDFYIRFLIPKI